jgi:hypothetical protein
VVHSWNTSTPLGRLKQDCVLKGSLSYIATLCLKEKENFFFFFWWYWGFDSAWTVLYSLSHASCFFLFFEIGSYFLFWLNWIKILLIPTSQAARITFMSNLHSEGERNIKRIEKRSSGMRQREKGKISWATKGRLIHFNHLWTEPKWYQSLRREISASWSGTLIPWVTRLWSWGTGKENKSSKKIEGKTH